MSENPPETQVSEPVVAPTATQEPTPEAPIPPSTSEQASMPLVAPESPWEAESAVPVNIDNEPVSPVEPENQASEQTAQIEEVEENKPVSAAPIQATAQMPVIEPLAKLGLLAKAREMIQFRKRKKLEKIMSLFLKQASITNDEVEKLLHVSDATATRYLEQLEKEGKIKQSGRTGTGVSYSRIQRRE